MGDGVLLRAGSDSALGSWTARPDGMSSSTPQGPGPRYGSNPDGTPIDAQAELEAELDEEAAAGDDGSPIDISRPEGPEISGGDDVE
jgi:hypothetical protein